MSDTHSCHPHCSGTWFAWQRRDSEPHPPKRVQIGLCWHHFHSLAGLLKSPQGAPLWWQIYAHTLVQPETTKFHLLIISVFSKVNLYGKDSGKAPWVADVTECLAQCGATTCLWHKLWGRFAATNEGVLMFSIHSTEACALEAIYRTLKELPFSWNGAQILNTLTIPWWHRQKIGWLYNTQTRTNLEETSCFQLICAM